MEMEEEGRKVMAGGVKGGREAEAEGERDQSPHPGWSSAHVDERQDSQSRPLSGLSIFLRLLLRTGEVGEACPLASSTTGGMHGVDNAVPFDVGLDVVAGVMDESRRTSFPPSLARSFALLFWNQICTLRSGISSLCASSARTLLVGLRVCWKKKEVSCASWVGVHL